MSDQKKIELKLPVTAPNLTVIELLSNHSPLSKQKLKDALNKGCVWQTQGKKTQRVRRAKKVLTEGSCLDIYYDPKVLSTPVPEPTLISDLGDYSVWYKPAGLLSQGSKWGDHCTIVRWAEQHLTPQRNAFVVHRLDRAAKGLIIVAHSKKAAAALSKLFAERKIDKFYHAIVNGKWPDNAITTIAHQLDGKASISHVELLRYDDHTSHLNVKIDTGRKHQIRRHLAMSGYPIVGDRLYNSDNPSELDLQLTAYKIQFQCPLTSETRVFELDEDLSPL